MRAKLIMFVQKKPARAVNWLMVLGGVIIALFVIALYCGFLLEEFGKKMAKATAQLTAISEAGEKCVRERDKAVLRAMGCEQERLACEEACETVEIDVVRRAEAVACWNLRLAKINHQCREVLIRNHLGFTAVAPECPGVNDKALPGDKEIELMPPYDPPGTESTPQPSSPPASAPQPRDQLEWNSSPPKSTSGGHTGV